MIWGFSHYFWKHPYGYAKMHMMESGFEHRGTLSRHDELWVDLSRDGIQQVSEKQDVNKNNTLDTPPKFNIEFTPPKFNSSPLKSYLPNRKGSSSNHHFAGSMLNFWGLSLNNGGKGRRSGLLLGFGNCSGPMLVLWSVFFKTTCVFSAMCFFCHV